MKTIFFMENYLDKSIKRGRDVQQTLSHVEAIEQTRDSQMPRMHSQVTLEPCILTKPIRILLQFL